MLCLLDSKIIMYNVYGDTLSVSDLRNNVKVGNMVKIVGFIVICIFVLSIWWLFCQPIQLFHIGVQCNIYSMAVYKWFKKF